MLVHEQSKLHNTQRDIFVLAYTKGREISDGLLEMIVFQEQIPIDAKLVLVRIMLFQSEMTG